MNKKLIIAPSILSADFMKLDQELKLVKENNLNWIHYDVMDYDFVPNLTFGAKILNDIKKHIDINVDIHFMVKVKTKHFTDFFKDYIKTKPQMMTMHIESMSKNQIQRFIKLCKENKIKASLALSPSTNIKKIVKWLPDIDNVLVMSVEPGFGGQKFIDSSILKIVSLKKIIDSLNLKTTVEIDGGINNDTFNDVKKSGVDMIVVGSYLFENNFSKNLDKLLND